MMKYILLFSIILVGCGIESASNSNEAFTFTLNTTCLVSSSASDCIQANNNMGGRAYGVLRTCASLFDTSADSSEINTAINLAFTTSTDNSVNCTASSCSASFNSWSSYSTKGSATFFVLYDSDRDGIYGEPGEPFACEDDINFEVDVLESIIESSSDLGYTDVL